MRRYTCITLLICAAVVLAITPLGADPIRGIIEQLSLDNMVDNIAYLSGETSNIHTRWSPTQGA